ncbi:MAG TPA: GTP cyclohydrolase I [Acidimicrobiales bacterium]|nr:GTP cyclohydrolase I [Acidimicrobiales bacterium]
MRAPPAPLARGGPRGLHPQRRRPHHRPLQARPARRGVRQRPQVQERLTSQVADTIQATITPVAVLVVVEAEHLCMSMRGIKKPGAKTVTSAVRGHFRESVAARNEAMSFITGPR